MANCKDCRYNNLKGFCTFYARNIVEIQWCESFAPKTKQEVFDLRTIRLGGS